MFRWQLDEYLSLPYLFIKVLRANADKDVGLEEKIIFGAHPQQYSLVFRPLEAASQRNSVVFFVPGGGWRMGNPAVFRFMGRFFAALGFPTVLAGYRLAPTYQFPIQLEDTYAAFESGMAHLNRRGIAVKRIVLGGQSAGAQLVSLLAYNQERAFPERSLFSGLVVISGPLDFSVCQNRTMRQLLRDYLGNLPNREIADPIYYARPDLAMRVLCLHGERDPLVAVQNSWSFAGKLNQGATPHATVRIIPKGHHSDLVDLFLEDSADGQFLTNWLMQVDKG